MRTRPGDLLLVTMLVTALLLSTGITVSLTSGSGIPLGEQQPSGSESTLGAAQIGPSPTGGPPPRNVDLVFEAVSVQRLPPPPDLDPDTQSQTPRPPPAITPVVPSGDIAAPKNYYKLIESPSKLSAGWLPRIAKWFDPRILQVRIQTLLTDILLSKGGLNVRCGAGMPAVRGPFVVLTVPAGCAESVVNQLRVYGVDVHSNQRVQRIQANGRRVSRDLRNIIIRVNELNDIVLRADGTLYRRAPGLALLAQQNVASSPYFCENDSQRCAALDLSALTLRAYIVDDGAVADTLDLYTLDSVPVANRGLANAPLLNDRALNLIAPGAVPKYPNRLDVFARWYTDTATLPDNNLLTRYPGFSGGATLAQNADGTFSILAVNVGVIRSCEQRDANNACIVFRNTLVSKLLLPDDISAIDASLRDLERGSVYFDVPPSDAGFPSPIAASATEAARNAAALCQQRDYIGGFLAPALDVQKPTMRLHCTGLTDQLISHIAEPAIINETIPRQNAIVLWGGGPTLATAPWSATNRVAHDHCIARGFVGGYFNGSEDAFENTYGIDCYTGAYATYYEVDHIDTHLRDLGVSSLDTSPWWLANRLATAVCHHIDGQDPSMLTGFFTGHRSGISGKFGLVCVGISNGRG